jgi:molybdenum cofactor cytidylyltransferase
MGQVVGIVLGAGISRRLGRPKQTLPLGDTTLLGWTVRAAESSGVDRVVVVVGASPAAFDHGRAEVVRNTAYGTGCASSLLTGLDAAGDADAIVMLLGDMPGVSALVIDQVVTSWRSSPSWAAVTAYAEGRLGHPFVFSADAFETLRGLHGDKAVWKVVDHSPPTQVRRIPVDRPLPRDVDTWEDYLAVQREFGP